MPLDKIPGANPPKHETPKGSMSIETNTLWDQSPMKPMPLGSIPRGTSTVTAPLGRNSLGSNPLEAGTKPPFTFYKLHSLTTVKSL